MRSNSLHAGVIGWPVSHSLSPALHSYWLKQYAIAGSYKAYELKPRMLPDLRDFMNNNDLCGINVTVPHKEAVMGFMDRLDEVAQAIGAVNVVSWDGNILHGANTDAYGFTEHLTRQAPGLKTQKAVVLGAGGAAHAVVYALKQKRFKDIVICNRTDIKANTLAKKHSIQTAPWEERANVLKGVDLLVNTTVLGMKDAPPLKLDLSLLPASATVYDLVYRPLVTELIQNARDNGNNTIDGLGMLIHQAVPCFEAWFGIRPDVTPALHSHLESLLV